MMDSISRQAALDALIFDVSAGRQNGKTLTLRYAKEVFKRIKALPSAQPEYERVSAENVAVRIAPTKIASAIWLYETLTELEKAGYVICRKIKQ